MPEEQQISLLNLALPLVYLCLQQNWISSAFESRWKPIPPAIVYWQSEANISAVPKGYNQSFVLLQLSAERSEAAQPS